MCVCVGGYCLWFWVFYHSLPLFLGSGHCYRGFCIPSSYSLRVMGHQQLGLWQRMYLRMGQVEFEISDCGGINCCYWQFFEGLASFVRCLTSSYTAAIKIYNQDKWFRSCFIKLLSSFSFMGSLFCVRQVLFEEFGYSILFSYLQLWVLSSFPFALYF